jgi:acylphosphatase
MYAKAEPHEITMKRARIIAKGEVQRVGYRDEVQRMARKLHITGFVENHKAYDVLILAEGEDELLEQFIEAIQIRKFPIEVEELQVTFEACTGEFEHFLIRRADASEELGERMDVAGRLLYRTVELGEHSVALSEESVSIGRQMLVKQDKSLEKQDQMLGKQNQMLEKQDQMLEKQDQMLGKQDQMLQKQDETTGEIRALRGDLKSFMEERFARLEREIGEIKARLAMA